ncbi:hypothetical protein KAS33_03765, partial [bacterium]|nr:hypothetical protein [bacterium]
MVFHDGGASVNVQETISAQAQDEWGNDATGPPNDNPPYNQPEFQATYYTGTATFTVTGYAKVEEPASATYTFTEADHGFTTFKISDDYVENVQLTARDVSYPTIDGTSQDLSINGIKVTPFDWAPTNVFQGEGTLPDKESVAMLMMKIQANPGAPSEADEATWTNLKIYRIDYGADSAQDGDVPEVMLWKDGNGDGEFDAPLPPDNFGDSDDILLAVGSFAGETGILNLNLSPAQILDTTLRHYFLVVNVSTTAVPGRKFGIEIKSPGDFTLGFREVEIGKDNFAIQTSSSTIQSAPAEMQVTPYNMVYSTQTYQQGHKDLAMLKVTLATDKFTANWTKIKVTRKGTGGLDSDVEEIKIYRDVGDPGFKPGVDTVVSSGFNEFDAAQVLINIDSDIVAVGDQPELVTATPQDYFIVFSIHDSATVEPPATIGAGCGVGSFWVESPATVNQNPFESGKPTITATEDDLIVQGGASGGSVNVAPAQLVQGTTNQAMLHFKLSADYHTVLWNELRVDLIGAGTYTDVDRVKLFKYNSGAVDGMGYPIIDFDGPDNDLMTMVDNDYQLGWSIFTSTTTLISISNPVTGYLYEEITDTPQDYLVTLDVDVLAQAPLTDALGLSVSSSTYFSVLGADIVSPTGFPRFSGTASTVKYADIITVVPESLAPATAMQGSGDPDPEDPIDPPAPILQLDLSCDQSDSIWTNIRIEKTGTAEDSEVTSVTVWKDNPYQGDIGNFDIVNDILISDNDEVFISKTANILLTDPQTIITATQRYFIAYGIKDAAIPGGTLGAKIEESSWITVEDINETVEFTVLPATSTLLQIYPKPRTLTVNGFDIARTSTTLSTVISSTDTVIPVDSTLSFLSSGDIKIDNEIIKYTGKTGTTFEGVTRGASGSQATSHLAGATVEKYFFQNDKDVWMASLDMISNSPFPVGVGWDGLRLILTGTGLYTDITEVKVWRDNNNNQIKDGMDVLVTTATFTGTDVSIQFPATQYVYDYTQYYFLTYSISGSAIPNAEAGLKIDGANDIYQISPHSMEGTFPIQSTEIEIHPTRDELITSFTDISGAAVPLIQGDNNVGMLKMILSSSENTVIWNKLRVERTGTGTDSDVSTIKIYRDEAPYEGTFNPANDSLITTGVNTFIDTLADITLLQSEIIDTTPRSYFVVLDIYQLAEVGKSVGITISSSTYFTVQGVDIVKPVSFVTTNLIVNEYADTITVTPLESTQTPAQVVQGVQNMPMHKFTLKTNQSGALWTGMKVRRTGTPLSRDVDVERVKIYRDLDNNGLFSATSDVEI